MMVDTENENNIRWKLSSRVGLVVESLLQYKMEIVRFINICMKLAKIAFKLLMKIWDSVYISHKEGCSTYKG